MTPYIAEALEQTRSEQDARLEIAAARIKSQARFIEAALVRIKELAEYMKELDGELPGLGQMGEVLEFMKIAENNLEMAYGGMEWVRESLEEERHLEGQREYVKDG